MIDAAPHFEPVWPLTAVAIAAALLVGVTVWTYQDVRLGQGRRLWVLLAMRLAALAVACIELLRPTWELRDEQKTPATLLILIDGSRSMQTRDEDPGRSRWDALRGDVRAAFDVIEALRIDQNVQILLYQFDAKLREARLSSEPDGEATALLQALADAYERHKPFDKEKSSTLLGIVVLSDGRDNAGKPALETVLRTLQRAGCPVHTIGLGHPGGSDSQADLAAQAIDAPQTARIKDRITVRGTIQAQRFAGREIEVWLLIDGKPVPQADDPAKQARVVLRPDAANQVLAVEMPACKLPDQAGDIRLSLRVTPVKGELTDTNNEVSTYVTLVKEGLSVLYFEKDRAWEPKFLRRALRGDERITLYTAYLAQDSGEEADRWRQGIRDDLERTNYDVFIFGDMPASRFAPETKLGAEILSRIEKAVSERGAGLLMLGGHESFGNSRRGGSDDGWRGTPMERILPITMRERGHIEGLPGGQRDVRFVPTDAGLRHFILRLESSPERNQTWWDRLPPLSGGNRIGERKPAAVELARSADGDELLVVQDYGKGRTAALAVDTTWRWIRDGPPHDPRQASNPKALSESTEAHLRFWRQLILWLAKQEEAGKALRVELDHRRLAAGRLQGISVQARELTPGGSKDLQKPLKDAEFTVKVIKPNKEEESVLVSPDGTEEGRSRGGFAKTDEAGEYEVVVTARHQGVDLGMARARFMAYRDDQEALNRSANHALLEQLARGTDGTHRLHGGLRSLLAELKPAATTRTITITKLPDWEQPHPWLQTVLFLIFVGAISAEWLCRRLWGLV